MFHRVFRFCYQIGLLLLLGPLVSCNSQHEPTWITSSDDNLRRMSENLLEDVVRFSGLKVLERIHLDYLTEEEISEHVRSRLETSLPQDKESFITESYGLLGLLPMNLDLRETLSDLYGGQVIGFYDPDDKALYLQEKVSLESLESLLVHELVHALQDQHFDLNALTGEALNNDAKAAAMAAIEGHATLVMLEFLSEGTGDSTLDMEDVSDFGIEISESIKDGQDGLDEAPLLLKETMFFPYIHGSQFVKAMRDQYGVTSVPFGSNLPKSTEEVLHFGEQTTEEMGTPLVVRIKPDDKWTKLYEDTLGELEVSVLLGNVTGQKTSAKGWKGDRFALLEKGDGGRTLVWFSVWDNTEDRDRVVGILASHSKAGYLELSRMNLDGFPAVRVDIGPEAKVEVKVE